MRKRGVWLLFLGFFALFLRTSCQTVYWGEGPLLAIAANHLGISHPPGYSLYVQFAHLIHWLPFGELPYRLAVISAFWSAAALAVLYQALLLRRIPPLAAAMAVASAGLGGQYWGMSTLAEVYSLNHFLFAVLALAASRWMATRLTRWALASAFVWALGLTHHMTMVFGGLMLLPMLFDRSIRRLVVPGALLTVLGLSVLLYFPVRAGSRAIPKWGQPDSLARFVTLVTAREEVVPSVGLMMGQLRAVPYWAGIMAYNVREELGPLGFLGVILGGAVIVRRRRWEELPAWLSAGALFAAVVVYQSNERAAFLLPALVLVTPAIALGLAECHRLGGLAAILALAVLLIPRFATNFAFADRSGIWYVRAYGVESLRQLPEQAVLFTEESDKYFLVSALSAIEGNHAGCMMLFHHLLQFPWYQDQLYRAFHRTYYVPPATDFARVGAGNDNDAVAEALLSLNAPHFPILLQDATFFIRYLGPSQHGWRVSPLGTGFRLNRKPGPDWMADGVDDSLFESFIRQGFASRDRLTADLFSNHLFSIGLLAAESGHRELARRWLTLSLQCRPNTESAARLIRGAIAALDTPPRETPP